MATKLEYIWLDSNSKFRSKVKVIHGGKPTILPKWNYDGSSTGQRTTNESEVTLLPVFSVKSPFSKNAWLVLCESESRRLSIPSFSRAKKAKPMFGFEQEFFLISKVTDLPIGWKTSDSSSLSQGPYYCAVGQYAAGREFMEKVVDNCIFAELPITGYNLEVAPGQLEIQICGTGIDAADQFMMTRYILERTAELQDCYIDYRPKPFPSLNGSGCHINFSLESMRTAQNYREFRTISNALIDNLSKSHSSDMAKYGKDNEFRLIGSCETSSISKFSAGVADRTASIRIPPDELDPVPRYYIEDRRPAANIDPYIACTVLLDAIPSLFIYL